LEFGAFSPIPGFPENEMRPGAVQHPFLLFHVARYHSLSLLNDSVLEMSMKTLLAFALLALLAFSAAAQQKIGIIDLRKVFDDYHKTKTADAALKDEASDLEKERKALMDQYQKTTDDYRKALDGANDQAVSSEEREKRKKSAEGKLLDIKSLEQNITDFDKAARTRLEEKQRRMRDNILGEIRNVINAKAKAAGYSMVIDSAAETINRTPVLIYSNGENDITTAVLAQLNVTAPAATTKPDDKKK
jgi:outer membrane protein